MDLSPELLSRARRAVWQAARTHLYDRNVNLIDFGFPERQGQLDEDDLNIRFHVHKKLPEIMLQTAAEEGMTRPVPRTVDGFRTDVIQATFQPELPWWNGSSRNGRAGRRDPLAGGISISNNRHFTYGTLGGLVVDRRSGEPMILSNWHVLVGDWGNRQGQPIYQPGRSDGGTYHDTIARLTRDAMRDNLDAAVAQLTGARQLLNDQEGIGPVQGVMNVQMGTRVIKSGRASSITYGIITGVEGLQALPFAGLTRVIRHVIEIRPRFINGLVSLPGDSGSWWLEQSGHRATALHFAGSIDGTRALAMNMPHVLAALGVTLPSQPQMRRQVRTVWQVRRLQFA